MTKDERFIVPDEKYRSFNQDLPKEKFDEYFGGNFFVFKDGKLIKNPCNCSCELEQWKLPEDIDVHITVMNMSLEKHIQNEIELRLAESKERIEKQVRKKYPKFKRRFSEESSTS